MPHAHANFSRSSRLRSQNRTFLARRRSIPWLARSTHVIVCRLSMTSNAAACGYTPMPSLPTLDQPLMRPGSRADIRLAGARR
jgi:hypothetical protein